MKYGTTFVFLVFLAVTTAKHLVSDNILFRATFEEGDIQQLIKNGWTSSLPFNNLRYWPEGVKVELTGNTFFSGRKSLMLQSTSLKEPLVHIATPLLKVRGGSRLKISAIMKLENVTTGEKDWYKARMGYGTYDKDLKPIQGGFKSFAIESGTRDWTRYETIAVIPPDAEYFFVSMELKNCRGTAWFDDIKIELLREGDVLSSILSKEEKMSFSEPIIIPKPWKESYSGKLIPFKKIFLSLQVEEETARVELIKFIDEFVGDTTVEKLPADKETVILLGPPDNSEIKRYLDLAGVEVQWEELEEQGYVVYAGTLENKNIVILTGTTPAGRFYALQTFKQLLVNKDGANYVYAGLIIDRPLYKMRGAVFGDLRRWYNGPPQRKNGSYEYSGWSYRERFHKLKLNFVWLAGWGGHRSRTVLPLNENDIKILKDFLEDCRKYFITPCVGLSPYRQLPYPGGEKGGVIYSSEKDINGVVNNLVTMYHIGYKNLFLAFDDLPPHRFLEYEQDKKRFKSIGEAHLYFIGEVYRRLKEQCPDVTLRIIGVAYGGGKQMPLAWKEYLKDVSQLPREIEFVFTSLSSEDVIYSSDISGSRGVITWSNYYAGLYEKLAYVPVIADPYEADSTLYKYTTGHFVLFVDLPNEDAAHITWYSASDYMWNPENYNPVESAKRALIKSVGYEGYQVLKKYTELTSRVTNEGVKGRTYKERIDWIDQNKKELGEYTKKFQHVLPKELSQALIEQSTKYSEFLSLLSNQYKKKSVPVPVKKFHTVPVIDGHLDDENWKKTSPLTDFLNLSDNSPAELQTTVYMGYDANNLYIAARMEEPVMEKLKGVFTERDSSVFIDDSVEIFLGCFDNIQNYWHIAVNSLGTVYDAIGKDNTWNGRYEIAITKEEDAWIIEMAISWENFDFRDKNVLRFNFVRNRYAGGKREHSTYAPLFGSSFHLPQWFWLCQLE